METFLRTILERKAIGAARIGGPSSAVIERYGIPTVVSDPREAGRREPCKIWNYDELQVWADASGVIDRVSFVPANAWGVCLNRNFNSDMAVVRAKFNCCKLSCFERSLRLGDVKTQRTSRRTQVAFEANGINVFAVFLTREIDGPQYLVHLRFNTI